MIATSTRRAPTKFKRKSDVDRAESAMVAIAGLKREARNV